MAGYHWPLAIGLHHLGHGVVDLQDDPLGAVLAVGLLVVLADDGEGVEDAVGVVVPDAVEVEEGRVQLAAKQEAAPSLPLGSTNTSRARFLR